MSLVHFTTVLNSFMHQHVVLGLCYWPTGNLRTRIWHFIKKVCTTMSLGLEEMLQNNFFYTIPVLVFNNKLAYLVFGHEKHSRY